jgi:predicted esterase
LRINTHSTVLDEVKIMVARRLAIGLAMLAGILVSGCAAGYVDGIGAISTDNYANPSLEYYYYIPKSVIESSQGPHPVLVMVPGLSGRGDQFVSQEFKKFADSKAMVIVAPSFIWDEANWDSGRSYQYPAVWSGTALLRIIDQVEEKEGITTSRFYVFGFSAGAQFALRFCLWKPEKCIACAAHASGGTAIPDRKVDVRFLVTVGTQDTSRTEIVQAFYNAARSLGIAVEYKEYSTGHSLTSGQIEDSLRFYADGK